MTNQNRRLILTAFLTLSSLMILSACSSYDVERPELTQEKIQTYNQQIEDSEKKLENKDINNADKLMTIQTQGIAYERLGKYDNAIEKYKEILEIAPTNFIALNNLSAIYEEVGDTKEARKYVSVLFDTYKMDTQTNQGVVGDTIRILSKNQEFDAASNVLMDYAKNFQSKETGPFISEQFEYIKRMKAAASK